MKIISTEFAPKPVAAYAQGIEAGGFCYTAGVVGVDPVTGKLVEGLEAQAERAFENVRAILAACELSAAALVKVSIFMTDLSQFQKVNEIYARFVGVHRPARTTVGVAALPLGALIEIDAIAEL